MTDHPTPTYQPEKGRVPDGYEFATELEYDEAIEIAETAVDVSAGDVVDFQSGLPIQTVDKIELQTGRDGTDIRGKENVSTVLILFKPNTDTSDNPVTGDDTISISIGTNAPDGPANTATVIRNNYHSIHNFTYGDILSIEPTEDKEESDFVVDWQIIPECMNPNYCYPDTRDNIPHGVETREESRDELFNKWANESEKKTVIDTELWLDKEYKNTVSTESPVLLVPILHDDGVIALQDIGSDKTYGYMDISQCVDDLHDNAIKHIDDDLRKEFLKDIRYPFGITVRNDNHLD